MKLGITRTFQLDPGGSFFEGQNIFCGQLYACSAEVLLEPRKLRRAGNRDNPGFLREQPCKRDLCRRGLLLLREGGNHIDQSLVGPAVVRTEPRYSVAEVGAVELGLSVNFSRQEPLAKRAERHEADAKLLKRRHHR